MHYGLAPRPALETIIRQASVVRETLIQELSNGKDKRLSKVCILCLFSA